MAHSRPSISSSYCALLLLLIASWKIPPHWLPCPANHFLSPFTYFCSLSSPKRSIPAPTRALSTLFHSHHTSRRGCGSPRHSVLCFRLRSPDAHPGLCTPPPPPPPPTSMCVAHVGARVPAACQALTCGWRAPAATAESGEQVSPPPQPLIHCSLVPPCGTRACRSPGPNDFRPPSPASFPGPVCLLGNSILMPTSLLPPDSNSLLPQLL